VSIRSARYNLLSLRNPKGLTVIPEERDAWAFLDAAAITSSRQQRAVIELVRGLKHAQLWTKMKAIYPFVGGTATTHKFNLKDPRDADAAFRLTFSGGWTHASTGALPNGTNAYADTFLIPNNVLSLNSTHISAYSRTNTITLAPLISDPTGTGTSLLNLWPRYSNTNDIYFRVNSSPTASAGTTTSSIAYYIANRFSSTETRNFRNTTSYVQSATSGTLSTFGLYLSRQGGAYNDRQTAFATIGDGLTDTDATNLYNIVQRFQTSLGRQV
jgi:hypothetical protein